MTVATIQAQTCDVMLVAEWNWLIARDRGVGDVLRACDRVAHCDYGEWRNQDRDQHHTGNRVGRRTEDLRHGPASTRRLAKTCDERFADQLAARVQEAPTQTPAMNANGFSKFPIVVLWQGMQDLATEKNGMREARMRLS
jgi:hypothetical protein